MATAQLNQIDDRLKELYSNQVTTNAAPAAAFEDKSEILYAQMNFIAIANRQALKLI
jgi:hypothetical protein